MLYRFGRAAVRLDEVVGIKEIRGDDGALASIRVYYAGQREVDFESEDADALRAYVASLPVPVVVHPPAPVSEPPTPHPPPPRDGPTPRRRKPGQVPNRDPATGQVIS